MDVPVWACLSCLSPVSAQMRCHGGVGGCGASALQQHPPCFSRVKSDSLAGLSCFWKTLPSLLRDPGPGSAPGLEQRQALGAVWMTRCLWPQLSPCAAGPCYRDQVLIIPHLPGGPWGCCGTCCVQCRLLLRGLSCSAGAVTSLMGSERFRQLPKRQCCQACPEPCALRGAASWAYGGTQDAWEARGLSTLQQVRHPLTGLFLPVPQAGGGALGGAPAAGI